MRIGNTKLPAAVPDTQIPLANARRLLKYIETIIMPGVVLKPPPMPVLQKQKTVFFYSLQSSANGKINKLRTG